MQPHKISAFGQLLFFIAHVANWIWIQLVTWGVTNWESNYSVREVWTTLQVTNYVDRVRKQHFSNNPTIVSSWVLQNLPSPYRIVVSRSISQLVTPHVTNWIQIRKKCSSLSSKRLHPLPTGLQPLWEITSPEFQNKIYVGEEIFRLWLRGLSLPDSYTGTQQ